MSLCLHWLLGRRLSYIRMTRSLPAASTSCFPPGNSQVRFSALPSSYSLFSGCYRLHTLLLHRRALWMFLYNVCIRYHTSGRTRQMDPNRSKHSQWLQNTVQRCMGLTAMGLPGCLRLTVEWSGNVTQNDCSGQFSSGQVFRKTPTTLTVMANRQYIFVQ